MEKRGGNQKERRKNSEIVIQYAEEKVRKEKDRK